MTTADVSKLTYAQREEIAFIRIQRTRANLLCFSDLCVKTVCRRARTCSADPDICMGQLAQFVPAEARRGVDALLLGKLDGLTYDEVCAQAPREVGAYGGWIESIIESRRDRAQARLHPKPRS